ncbi:hypothetical protein RRG08_025381 [Elysia crispata]|uniref:Uncharacterized protein n=1 Tax=Elysia crispata TaxID=231223 RepID=A0AAE1B6J0_9GAST|nr:hypothetical protein RRG08_025381 [Elysia crispata]
MTVNGRLCGFLCDSWLTSTSIYGFKHTVYEYDVGLYRELFLLRPCLWAVRAVDVAVDTSLLTSLQQSLDPTASCDEKNFVSIARRGSGKVGASCDASLTRLGLSDLTCGTTKTGEPKSFLSTSYNFVRPTRSSEPRQIYAVNRGEPRSSNISQSRFTDFLGSTAIERHPLGAQAHELITHCSTVLIISEWSILIDSSLNFEVSHLRPSLTTLIDSSLHFKSPLYTDLWPEWESLFDSSLYFKLTCGQNGKL